MTNKTFAATLFLALSFLVPSVARAQSPSRQQPPLGALQELFHQIPEVVKSEDTEAMDIFVKKVRIASAEAGMEDAEIFAEDLRSRAVILAFQDKNAAAANVLRAAYALAPSSVSFIVESSSLRSRLLEEGSLLDVIQALHNIRASEVVAALYGLLPLTAWSLVFASLLALFLALFLSIPEYFHELREKGSGTLLPMLLFAVILILPLYLGPLWTLFAWGSAISLINKQHRVLAFFAGISLTLWAVSSQASEQIFQWRGNGVVQQAVALSESRLSTISPIPEVHGYAKSMPDPYVLLGSARLYRIQGDFTASQHILNVMEEMIPNDRILLQEQALLFALQDDFASADKLFSESEGLRYEHAYELLNQSKIKYALTKVLEGEAYYTKARERNADFVAYRQELESLPGSKPMRTWIWPRPSFSWLTKSIEEHSSTAAFRTEIVREMPGSTRSIAAVLGLVVCAIACILPPTRKRSQRLISYGVLSLAKYIPGGGFIAAKKHITALLLLFIFSVTICTGYGWPEIIREFTTHYPEVHTWSFISALLVGLIGLIVGVRMSNKAHVEYIKLSVHERSLLFVFFGATVAIPAFFWGQILF